MSGDSGDSEAAIAIGGRRAESAARADDEFDYDAGDRFAALGVGHQARHSPLLGQRRAMGAKQEYEA
jgi:hypothetical protein